MGRAQEEPPFVDDVEAELRVQLPRPVVGERLEEDELVPAPCLVERVLHHGPAEPAAAVLLERGHVLDLRRAGV